VGPSISLPIPLFDQAQAGIAADQARLKQAIERHFSLAVRLRARVRSTQNSTQSAREKAVYYQHIIIPLRHKIVEETQLQYNAMQMSTFQLLQAKRDEIDAGTEYVESLRDYWLASAELDLLVNGRMPRLSERMDSMMNENTEHHDFGGQRGQQH